jgi:O-antigen/teichoic acid export membrane protein
MLSKFFNYLKLPGDLSNLILTFFSANIAGIIAQTISGLIVARMILPEDMGLLNTASIAMTFIPFVLLGTNNGLNRQLPFLIGQGKSNEVSALRNTAFSWSLYVSVVILIVIGSVGIYYQTVGKKELALAFYSVAISGSFFPLTSIIEVTFRTAGDFIRLSKIKLAGSLFSILTIPIVYYFGYNGLLIRSVLITAFSLLILYIYKTNVLQVHFHKEQFFTLLKVGMPIFFWAYIYSVFIGLDKVFIANYFSEREMGLFTPAIQVTAGLSVLPNSIFQVIYPRLCQRYGETGTIQSMMKLIMIPLKYLALGLIPIFVFVIYLVDPFIRIVLPNYVDGIVTAQWAIVAVYFRCLGGGQDVLTVISKLNYYGLITFLSAGVYYIVFRGMVLSGWGLESVSASFAVSMMFFNIMVMAVLRYFVYTEKKGISGVV